MFVTGLYAVLSLESGQFVYANAGHHPPMILRSDTERVEQLERGETALGVLEGVQFRDHGTALARGDCMVLFTDGVTEALSPAGVFYGEDRLREIIQRSRDHRSAQETLDSILDAVADFVGDNPPSDDLTLMVLRRQGP
jgi:sigma-B regulation protein RsbU (phosphoserine phosphatase)